MKLTRERIERYGVVIDQPASGYRYNEDSFLLVEFVDRLRKAARVADLGAGCGIVGIALAARFPTIHVTAVEIRPELEAVIAGNAGMNGMSDRFSVVSGDLRALDRDLYSRFDAVVANPPYRTPGTGRVSPDPHKAAARHHLHGGIGDIALAAGRLLKDGGTFWVVYLAERLAELFGAMAAARIEPKRLVPVCGPGGDAFVVLVKGVARGGTGLVLEQPVISQRCVRRRAPAPAR